METASKHPGLPAPRVPIGWTTRVGVLVCLATLCAVQATQPDEPVFPFDDSYITAHNAQVLVRGSDSNFPGVPALQGATSMVHTGLVAMFIPVTSPDWALFIVGWIGIFLYGLATLEIARTLQLDAGRGLLLVVVALVLARTPHQLTNGLETGLAMAGVAWALALEARPRAPSRVLLPILLGILPFIRPAFLAFTAIIIGSRTLRAVLPFRTPVQARHLPRDLALVVGAALPFLLVQWSTTGSLFPTTVNAKMIFFAEGCLPAEARFQLFSDGLLKFAQDLGWAVWLTPLLFTSRVGALGAAFSVVTLATYYFTFPGALHHYEGRYLYGFVPCVVFGMATLLAGRGRARQWIGLLAVGLILYDAHRNWTERQGIHFDARRFTDLELRSLATWINHVLPDGKILVHDVGYVSAKTGARLVDMVGLKTADSAAVHAGRTWSTCGADRVGAIAEIASRHRPQYLIVFYRWDRIFGITKGLRLSGWDLQNVGPKGAYSIFRLTPPPFAR